MGDRSAAVRPPFWSMAAAGATDDLVKSIRGRAWACGVKDRMNRVILPGGFGDKAFSVPLLAYHDDTQAIGTADMTPTPDGLDYIGSFVDNIARIDELRMLIRAGAVPAVSIGWIATVKPNYIEGESGDWDDYTIYFPKVDVVELSVVPVPAQPAVTLEAASLLRRQFAGKGSDAEARIQAMHDHAAAMGATCVPGSNEPDAGQAQLVQRALLDVDLLELTAQMVDL